MQCPTADVVLDHAVLQRYLGLLGVRQKRPVFDALAELVAAQIMRVPFENISKLHRLRSGTAGLAGIETFLDGIEQYNFGGTCYSNNFHFYTLLASLGYDVRLCSADMANPDVHMVIIARVDGREFLVDVGYAAPFLAPLPRDLRTDFVIALGRDRYVLKPQDPSGRSRLELYRDGALTHGYLAKPGPRRIADFSHVIADSFRPAATFLNAILLARFFADRSVVIHNLSLIQSHGSQSNIRPLKDRGELTEAIERHFEIPREISASAVQGLGQLGDAWT